MKKSTARCWIIVVAVAFAVNYFFNSFFLPFHGVPDLGIRLTFADDSPRISRVLEASPAAVAGLEAGDRIESFNAKAVRTQNDYFLIEQLIEPAHAVDLIANRAGQTFHARVELQGSYAGSLSKVNRLALVFWALLGAFELVLALSLGLSRPRDPSALFAALFLAALTTLNAQSVGWASEFRSLPLAIKPVVYAVCLIGLEIPFFGFIFLANFPRSLFQTAKSWVLSCLPAFLIYVFLLTLNFPLLFGRHPEMLFESRVGSSLQVLQIPIVVLLLGYAIAAVVAIVVNYRRCDLVERRRIKLMLVGALIGLGSVVPAAIIHDLIYSDLISRSGLVSIAFGLLRLIFLVCFVYAVLKQRVFDIPVLLQRSGRYLLVQRGYLILLSGAGLAATLIFARFFRRFFPAQADYSVAIGAIFGIGLVWLGSALHKRIQDHIDRAFFRSAYDAQHILQEMAERSRRATTRAELVAVLDLHVRRALHPQTSAVLLENPDGALESVSANGSPAITLSADAPPLKALAASGKPWEIGKKDWERQDLGNLAHLRPECLVPIIGRTDRLRGLLVLGPKMSEEPYSSGDRRLLRSAANQAGVALENIALAEDIALRLQAEQIAAHELAIAREVQSKLLPDSAPALRTLQCFGKCLQARQVGGDFYDFIEYSENKVGLVLADIAGKGISAALLMANLQAHLRSHRISTPKEIPGALESVNRHFRQSIEVGSFATLFFGFYDDATGVLAYANCGHAPAVIMRAGGEVHRLESTATVIGAFADWRSDLEQVRLDEGDVIVLYSDGITEAENAAGELFGEERLLELLNGCRGLGAERLAETIIGATLDFSSSNQLDDITLVVAKAVPVAASRNAAAENQSRASA